MSDSALTHDNEPHSASITGRLNWLRAAVLGANDGIVSVAASWSVLLAQRTRSRRSSQLASLA